jgi:hypothetical protein
MPLPQTIRVKLSTEEAGSISITPVVVQDIATRDLIDHMLAITGKDEGRIQELLRRGTFVSGASRFRWQGWDAERESIRTLLAGFPDPQPGRVFSAPLCTRAVLRGGRQAVEIRREAGKRRPLLRRNSFWDLLMDLVARSEPEYHDYSYSARADEYRMPVSLEQAKLLRDASDLLRYTTLRDQVRSVAFDSADLFVLREAPLP